MIDLKKIDELFDDYEMENEEININEESMTRVEADKIKSLTMQKCGLNNKRFKRNMIIPIAAAMTLVLSFAAVFAEGGFNNIFNNLFGENIKYVSDMGTVIDKSCSSNGIKLNVASMLGDENSFYIVFELIKENGETFEKSDMIEFENLHLQFNGSGGYSYYQIKDDDEKDNKATFILVGDTAKKTAGKKLTLGISDFTEYDNVESAGGFSPYDFLMNNQWYLNQPLEKNMQKSTIELNDKMTEEEKKKAGYIMSLHPVNVLPMKYSNISIGDGQNNITVDNIGFSDGKLCLRIKSPYNEDINTGYIYFENINDKDDSKYDEYMYTEEHGGEKYNYYVFDIKSMEELKKYSFKYCVTKKIKTTKGDWKVSFNADYKNTSRKINVNKEIEVDGKRYTVKSIKLSPISLNIELENNLIDEVENPVHNLGGIVSVNMKDGTVTEIGNSGISSNPLRTTMNFIFNQPVNISLIDSVKIGNVVTKINL